MTGRVTAFGLGWLACVLLLASAAVRAEFVEAPFAPAVGSRWIVDDVNDSETVQPDGKSETQKVSQKGEITFLDKSADGYRVSYVITDISVTGTSQAVEIVQTAFAALKGVVFKGETDMRGKPVLVENLGAVRAQMADVVDRTVQRIAKNAKVAQTMRSMMTALMVLDGRQAAENYLEPLALMAASQNTGLKPGDERTEQVEKPNPLGGDPIKSVTVTRVAAPDPDGVTIVTRTERLDKDSLKAALLLIARRMVRDMGGEMRGVTEANLEQLLDEFELSIDGLSVYDVSQGMAREITASVDTRVSALGHRMTKNEKRRVTITPAP